MKRGALLVLNRKKEFWEVTNKLQHEYAKISGYSDYKDKAFIYRDPVTDRTGFTQYLPKALNLKHIYMDGVDLAHHQVAEIRSHIELLRRVSSIHVLRVLTGYKNVENIYCYKLLITANNRGYRYAGGHIIDRAGALAHANIHSGLKSFRKRLSRIHSAYRPISTRLRNKYYSQLHTHDLVLSTRTDCKATARKWADYLSNQLGYPVSVTLTPVKNYFSQTNVVLNVRHQNPRTHYKALFEYLRYINRSWKLACPNPKHPERDWKKWQKLPAEAKRQYVLNTLRDTKSRKVRVNYNFNLARQDERIVSSIQTALGAVWLMALGVRSKYFMQSISDEADGQAVAEQHYYHVDLNRWKSHRKHLTSIQQWELALGHSYYSNEPRIKQMKLMLTPSAHHQSDGHDLICAILMIKAISVVKYIISHQINKNTTTLSSGNIIYTYTRNSTATVTAPSWFEKRTSGLPP